MPIDIPGFVYAGLVAAGGAFGYYRAGSIPSLAAGIVFGTALTYGAYQVSLETPNYSPQLATTSLLAGVMGYRYYNSGKIMPAGVIAAISVCMILRIAGKATGLISNKHN